MSIVNLESLEAHDLINQYVLCCRGQGTLLPYSDLQIIFEWLDLASGPDELLMVLDGLLPAHFAKNAHKKTPPSLKGIRKKVIAKIKECNMR